MSKKAHFFAVSGMRGTGRTKLFKQLKSLLPDVFQDQTFAFFDDPFGELPHPLLWAREDHDLDPVTRLFDCWKHLNEFNMKLLRPALETYDVVVTDGYGLNALLYATAYDGDNHQSDEDAIEMHHHIVAGRVIKQGIQPPEYLITRGDCDTLTSYLQRTVPDLSVEQCHAFIKKEEAIIDAYFQPDTGQKGQQLDASMSHDEMCDIALTMVSSRINSLRQVA